MIPGRTTGTSVRKAKKSYTLSPESVAFLEGMRKKRRAASISAVLEEILQEARLERERTGIERAVSAYYSTRSPEEVKEEARWGEFALQEFPDKERR